MKIYYSKVQQAIFLSKMHHENISFESSAGYHLEMQLSLPLAQLPNAFDDQTMQTLERNVHSL